MKQQQNKMLSKTPLLILLFFTANAAGQTKLKNINIHLLTKAKPSSFRGMSVVNDSVIWVCGSNGYIGCSKDAGKTWDWMQIPSAENSAYARASAGKLDFRSIMAFNSQKAVVVNVGSPAYIFLTKDGGKHWKKVYENDDKNIFLDGITFWDKKRGLVYGDPMRNQFVLLSTKDGGEHWKTIPFRHRPKAKPGEASFAASGTAIFSLPSGYVWIGTGGSFARILFSKNYGKKWKILTPPILQGKSSTGIFSLAFWDKDHGICVGGDYSADTVRLNNAFLTNDGGKTWIKPVINPFGYRSCIIYIKAHVLIATGTSGTDISYDEGMTWEQLSTTGFHVVQKARNGYAVYLAGSQGRIARLEIPQSRQLFPQNMQEKKTSFSGFQNNITFAPKVRPLVLCNQ